MTRPWLLLCLLLGAGPLQAAETTVAVAANFTGPARELADRFEQETGHRVLLAVSSTGKHHAQITQGAPYAAFLAADAERPRLLEQAGAIVPGSRFVYGIGRLVLWSPRPGMVDSSGTVLRTGQFAHLAVANEKHAPYGVAAVQVLHALDLWEQLQTRLVRGENIAQAFQFVQSGNAELGLVALSQYRSLAAGVTGSVWLVPQELHEPIRQEAVLLKDDPVARAFLEFLKSPAARDIITGYGYDLPEGPASAGAP